MISYYKYLCDELMRTVELVRGNISKQLRVAIGILISVPRTDSSPNLTLNFLGALVVMDVHNRDTINEMVKLEVSSINDFDWLSQLRCIYDSLARLRKCFYVHEIIYVMS